MHQSEDDNLDPDSHNKSRFEDLVVSGLLYLGRENVDSVQIQRGMAILTQEGKEAGLVAAVLINRHDQQITHILLGRFGQVPEYYLIPATFVEQVREESVLLWAVQQDIDSLPRWHGS